jgi:hypothetical protein
VYVDKTNAKVQRPAGGAAAGRSVKMGHRNGPRRQSIIRPCCFPIGTNPPDGLSWSLSWAVSSWGSGGSGEGWERKPSPISSANMMEYRGTEYAVVEGIGRHMWKWTAWVGGAVVSGQAHTKQAAVVSAEKAIDRSLAIKRVRHVPPERSD